MFNTCIYCGQEYDHTHPHDSYACHRYQAILESERTGQPIVLWDWDWAHGPTSFGYTRPGSDHHAEMMASRDHRIVETVNPNDRGASQ